ncbi:EF-hand domain-containing protein [Kushneria indalinina]|uniref:EF-hand domain-containing protein n=1 Tax=Kushneria indalinina DSM 14324 TaxID=1122140 RepID=A0A3D9DTM6_9GAMM|nr:EF-hand domain-containing protein [Kushneria indalinina]REC94021.1 hypothetical protein C8D72_2387 [Kushneria indalinina DSM 14324]
MTIKKLVVVGALSVLGLSACQNYEPFGDGRGSFSRAETARSDVDTSQIPPDVLQRFRQLDSRNEGYVDAQQIDEDPELSAILSSSDDSASGRLTLEDLARFYQ